MPMFPNGSTVWISDFDGGDFEEYGQTVEETDGTYTISTFIAAEKGQEWRVSYALALEGGTCMKLEVDADRQRVTELTVSEGDCGYEKYINGWQVAAWRAQRFTFGDIETEDTDEAWDLGRRKELNYSCIEVAFYGATVTGHANQPSIPIEPQMADAVHPDSKAASLLGIQVRPGSTEITGPVFNPLEVVGAQDGATRYVARFNYRPAKLLIAQSLMPEPGAKGKKGQQDRGKEQEDEDEEEEDEEDADLARALAASRAEARAQEARQRAEAEQEAEAEREQEPEPEVGAQAEAAAGGVVAKPEPGVQEEPDDAAPANGVNDDAVQAKEEPDVAPPEPHDEPDAAAAANAVVPKEEPDEHRYKRQKFYIDLT